MTTPLSIQDLRDRIHSGEISDPLVFLQSISQGQDPRNLSEIYKLVCEIDEFRDGAVAPEDWADVVDLVSSRYKYTKVTLRESIDASRTLAEYLHAKRKSVEISGDGNLGSTSGSGELEPLTEDEMEIFWEKFDERF